MGISFTAYHGTTWERPYFDERSEIERASVFHNLSSDHNDLHAFYMSDNEKVCEFFSDQKSGFDDDLYMQAMLKIEAKDAITYRANFTYKAQKIVEYKGCSYNYFEEESRIELYQKLKDDGIQIFIMEGDYITNDFEGSDIAVLDDSVIQAKEVKLKIKGKWGEYMSYEDACEVMSV